MEAIIKNLGENRIERVCKVLAIIWGIVIVTAFIYNWATIGIREW